MSEKDVQQNDHSGESPLNRHVEQGDDWNPYNRLRKMKSDQQHINKFDIMFNQVFINAFKEYIYLLSTFGHLSSI